MPDRDLVSSPQDHIPSAPSQGKNYLLAIAINDYLRCEKLNNAVRDVEIFISVLRSRYAFEKEQITLIKNAEATKRNIEQAFLRLIKTITPQDNLIVYFSGHGRYDEHYGGNWVPVDAGNTDEDWPDYLSNGLIKDYLSKIKSLHTFLIADSCFSGALLIDKNKEKNLENRSDTVASRWALTSGKKEIVSDGESGQHSPFAGALLDVLVKAVKPPTVLEICQLVLEKVAANATQTPMASPLAVSGHQGGQMIFYFKSDEESEWKTLGSTLAGCQIYLQRFPQGKYRALAEERLHQHRATQAWAEAKTSQLRYRLLEYEQTYPDTEPVRSGELHRLLQAIDETEMWKAAQQSNTVSAYRDYLRRSTMKLHEAEAEVKIKAIAAQEREDAIWRQARQGNSLESLGAYVKEYPQGRYAAEAQLYLTRLKQAEEEKLRAAQTTQGATPKPIIPPPTEQQKRETLLQDYIYAQQAPDPLKKKPRLTTAGIGRFLSIFVSLVIVTYLTYLATWPPSTGRFTKTEEPLKKNTNSNIPRPEMVAVTGGTFEMGDVMGDGESDDEKVHTVTLSDFKIGKTEVTFAEYDLFCEATQRSKPGDEGWGRGSHPVINVSWEDAVAYCNWLSTQHGYQPVYTINGNEVDANWRANGYRLPTEAEWEYAARGGGKKVRFGNGKDVADPKEINFNGSNKEPYSIAGEYRGKTVSVGSLNSPNALGLHDMSGNVFEWCWDWYDEGYYNKSISKDPRGPATGEYRVLRGGSWLVVSAGCLSSLRNWDSPTARTDYLGLRLAQY